MITGPDGLHTQRRSGGGVENKAVTFKVYVLPLSSTSSVKKTR